MLPHDVIEEQVSGRYGALVRREDWPARLADTIAGQVRFYRRVRDMTAQQLVDGCNALGLPMKRTVLTNLETGRRGNVSVAELLALAEVLDVPPVLLLFPLGREAEVEVLPERTMPTWDALKWFTGEPGQEPVFIGFGPLDEYREHDRLVSMLMRNRLSAGTIRSLLNNPDVELSEADRSNHRNRASGLEETAAALEPTLRRLRRIMRRKGSQPPELAPDLRYLDVDEVTYHVQDPVDEERQQ